MHVHIYTRWRAERREAELKKEVSAKREMLASMINITSGRKGKAWTLDEEDEDEEPAVASENTVSSPGQDVSAPKELKEETHPIVKPKAMEVDEEEEDPLDAFMKTVQDEVRNVNIPGNLQLVFLFSLQ